MQSQIIKLLEDSLNPQFTNQALSKLTVLRQNKNFSIELLLISDNSALKIDLRMSALICLKNLIADHCERSVYIDGEDLCALKSSLLEALIRWIDQPKMVPTMREIVYIMAKKYFPKEWPEVADQCVKYINQSGDFNHLYGSVECLRAIFGVLGNSLTSEIQLSNLCNKSLIGMLQLTTKSFQNYTPATSTILLSIFKTLSSIIYFHLPEMITHNIHTIMIFLKKTLDLPLSCDQFDNNLYLLKKIALRTVFRLYERHVNFRVSDNRAFAENFHGKYTNCMVETLMLQIVTQTNLENQRHQVSKGSKVKFMTLTKLALSCLAYINRQNEQASNLINSQKLNLLPLLLERFKTSTTKAYPSYLQYKLSTSQNRVHLLEFLFSLLRSEALPQNQSSCLAELLVLLSERLNKGNNEDKELSLYIFGKMSSQMEFLGDGMNEKMGVFIVENVLPLLGGGVDVLVRGRGCELISFYSFLELPSNSLQALAEGVYSCLLIQSTNTATDKSLYLKIQASGAFNSLLKYPQIVLFIKPFLKDVLHIYTNLLQSDTSVINNFKDILELVQDEVSPFANDLIEMLIEMFGKYGGVREEQFGDEVLMGCREVEEEEAEEEGGDYQDNEQVANKLSIAKATIESIRALLQIPSTYLSERNRQKLLQIMVEVLRDKEQSYLEEGFNILNLILYKTSPQEELPNGYIYLFKAIVYAHLGLPNNLLQSLQNSPNIFTQKYMQILENICVEPDINMIDDSIGCLRNFIAKLSTQRLGTCPDEYNFTLLDYLFRVVKFIHENESGKATEADRCIVLTIYISLLEHGRLDEVGVQVVVENCLTWMKMETEVTQTQKHKLVYTPIYIQIMCLAVHFYGSIIHQYINLNYLASMIIITEPQIKCDYELQRVIVGVSDVLARKGVTEQQVACNLMDNTLPSLVEKMCRQRDSEQEKEIEDEEECEVEEEKFFGQDENTMMGLNQFNKNKSKNEEQFEDEEPDNDWEEQFNKFYISPLEKVDELKYLQNTLQNQGAEYISFMNSQRQQLLSSLLSNTKPKKN